MPEINPTAPDRVQGDWSRLMNAAEKLAGACDQLDAHGGVRRATAGMSPAALGRATVLLHGAWERLDELVDHVEAARVRRRPPLSIRRAGPAR